MYNDEVIEIVRAAHILCRQTTKRAPHVARCNLEPEHRERVIALVHTERSRDGALDDQ